MPAFKTGGSGDFPERIPAEPALYRLRIENYRMAKTKPNMYDKEGGRDQIQFICDFVNIVGDEEAEISDVEGDVLDPDYRVIFFFDPNKTGLKPVVAKSRKFLADVLGIPVEQDIEYESYDDLADDFVDREFVADVGVKQSGDRRFNTILSTQPVRKKKSARVRAEKDDLTEAAAKVFSGEVEAAETVAAAEESADY